jgi:hypothetical protein
MTRFLRTVYEYFALHTSLALLILTRHPNIVCVMKEETLPVVYRVRLGERFAPPADVSAFTSALVRHYRHELDGALQSRWLNAGTT